jgi:acyl-CoA synthetase (AMP-forming)/AMP-acid ligase II
MILRSAQAAPDFVHGSLQELVLGRARDLPDKLALLDGASGRSFTYGELEAAVRRVAGSLAARGFRKGEVFAIACPNCAEFVLAFHAVGLLGGTVTTLNPAYTAEEMAHQLRDSGATRLLAHAAILPKAMAAAAAAGLREVISTGSGDGAEPFGALEGAGQAPPAVDLDPWTDLMALPYSSGTTGLPKGVMLTHANLGSNVLQGVACGLRQDDVILGILPLFHIFGMNVMMNTGFAVGATLVLLPRFDLEDFLAAIQRHRATYVFLVPPILVALAKHPLVAKYDLSSLDRLLSGAAPLGEALAREVEERIGCAVLQGYGLTETSPVALVSRLDGGSPKGSVGAPVAGTECRLVDVETGEAAAPGAPGELWLRGPQIMRGYLNRPEDTAAAIDAEGWLRTGDIARVDEEGCVFVVDRLKELIKVKGMQVAPAELEALLLTHPAVADAAVIPIPDEKAGERPKAFVVLRSGAEPDAEGILAFVAQRVAPHKRIVEVTFSDQIPKSPSGKILRRVLVAQERARAGGGAEGG